ncbi:5'-nucleotidase C-terminal domain-containing protein [Wenxinia marina]|nr:5'-nucleotidase C-terminal domain-containing protein [Wenxinia marina]
MKPGRELERVIVDGMATADTGTLVPAIGVRLIATTDLHFHVWPYDYATDRPAPAVGLAAAAETIAALRAEAPATLLFDNGDLLQGSALSDRVRADWEPGQGPHPLISAMNALGYDAATIGNHDLNFGLRYLRDALADAAFPVVSANLVHRRDGGWETLLPPTALLRRTVSDGEGGEVPLTIGIVGMLPAPSASWDRLVLGRDVETPDIVAAVAAVLPGLLAQKPDIVVALCHSGLMDGGEPGENAATAVAALDGIDVVVGGHTHEVFPGPAVPEGRLHGKPAVIAGSHGRQIGVVDLRLTRIGDRWRPIDAAVRTEPVSPVPDAGDAPEWDALRPYHARVLADVRRPLARLTAPLSTRFAMIGAAPAGQLLGRALRDHAAARLAGRPEAQLPILAATAPLMAGGRSGPQNYIDLPAGPITRGFVGQVYPFPNPVCLLRLTMRDVRDWLERTALAFRRIGTGPPGPLLTDAPPYLFDTIWGLRYAIDVTAPDGDRIRDLRLEDGTVLPGTAQVVVAVNSHRASGAGGYEAASRGTLLDISPTTLQQIFGDWLARKDRVTPDATPIWDFAPAPGRAAWIDTAPCPVGHVPDIPNRRLRESGEGSEGFCRIVIDL